MKLNNRGWGLTDYLLIVSVIIIALFGASVLIIRLSNGLKENMKVNISKTEETINSNNNNNKQESEESNNENINYKLVEQKMNKASIKHIEIYYKDIGDSGVIVDKQHLLELDDTLEKEMSKDNCKGYVEVKKIDNTIGYTPYLKCNNYSTNGVKDYYLD